MSGLCIIDGHTCPGMRYATSPTGDVRLSPYAKLWLVIAALQGVFLITTCALLLTEKPNEHQEYTERHMGLGLYITVAFLYFSFDCVFAENSFQLYIAVCASLLMTMTFAVSQDVDMLGSFWEDNSHIILYISIAFNACSILVAFPTVQNFGYRMYTSIGADVKLLRLYTAYEVFFAVLKIDVFLSSLLTIMVLVIDPQGVSEMMVCIGFACTLIWAPLGWLAAIHEKSTWMPLWFLFSFIEPAYEGYQLNDFLNGDDADNITNAETHEFIGFASLALAARLVLWIAAAVRWRHFGQGLKTRVFIPQAAHTI